MSIFGNNSSGIFSSDPNGYQFVATIDKLTITPIANEDHTYLFTITMTDGRRISDKIFISEEANQPLDTNSDVLFNSVNVTDKALSRLNFGLGSLATQDASDVNITGGTIINTNVNEDIEDLDKKFKSGVNKVLLNSDSVIIGDGSQSLGKYNIASESDLDIALSTAPAYSVLFFTSSITITTSKTITKPLYFIGKSSDISITSTNLVNMITIDSNDVYFINLEFYHNKTSTSVDSIISTINYRNNLVIYKCKFYCAEFSLILKSKNILISNNVFSYSPNGSTSNTYRSIGLYNVQGVNYIQNNSIINTANNPDRNQFIFQSSNNALDKFEGSLIIKNNIQNEIASRNFINFEVFDNGKWINQLSLIIDSNVYKTTSTDILLFGINTLSLFSNIVFTNNTTSSNLSSGSKGYISLDGSSVVSTNLGFTDIYAINNKGLQTNLRSDYNYNLIDNDFGLIGYKNTIYTNVQQFVAYLKEFENLPAYPGSINLFTDLRSSNNIYAKTISVDSVISNNGTLNLGSDLSSNIINIGCSDGIQIINLSTGHAATQQSTINIGSVGDIVNIVADLKYIDVQNLQIDNKTITLNKGSVGSSTARDVGILIHDNNIDEQGFFRTTSLGNAFEFKAPENSFILNTPVLNSNETLIVNSDGRLTNSRQCNNNFDDATTSRNNLGLGTMSTQNSSGINIDKIILDNLFEVDISNGNLIIRDTGDSIPRLIISNNNGHVGINTSIDPSYNLSVVGSINCSNLFVNDTSLGNMAFQNSNSVDITGGSISNINLNINSIPNDLSITTTDPTSDRKLIFNNTVKQWALVQVADTFRIIDDNDNDPYLLFYDNGNTVFSNNIGINTIPTEKLSINGNILLSGNICGPSSAFAYTIGANPNASITNGGYVQLWGSTSGNSGLIVLGNNNSSRMVIDNTGNVGIGTSNPGAKLHVEGQIVCSAPTTINHATTKAYVDNLQNKPIYASFPVQMNGLTGNGTLVKVPIQDGNLAAVNNFNATANSQFTVPVSGFYEISFSITAQNCVVGQELLIYVASPQQGLNDLKNQTTTLNGNANLSVITSRNLTSGIQIEFYVVGSTGTSGVSFNNMNIYAHCNIKKLN